MTTTTDDQSPEPVCPLSGAELFDTFTKFDEIAVAKAFGQDVYALRTQPFDFLRCLAFIHMKRGGLEHDKAREAAFNLSIKDLRFYFPRSADDLDPDEPSSDEGKDDSLSA